MQLRPAQPADAPTLAEFGRASFAAAFGHLYRPADLAAFEAETYAVETVAAEIAGSEYSHMLAESDGRLAGYCKMRVPSKLAVHSAASNPIELVQLYADPARTGQGIGAALMDWALGLAHDGGHDAILLSVWSGNTGAQRFYARYDFTKIADIHFRVGEQLDEEYLFEKRM
ncbi:GNAT family N-acetyltransferase [Erythrobacter mangrovi]|uniref:GNAT family N-acetyltransferase n=1 Tax=Erythrobacter mangrovi TaxID=2739433 RepID=A0A7D4B8V1_9SPHN|nr:GNAT family N-acetyltransferase [Erythrobacter mangrovi]QKG70541.1 GNAT family N-acetyltransferase [Erythrobacter mangrovi]